MCEQYDIDDRKMSEEQIEAVKAFLGRAKIIKAGKKGKLLKIGKPDSEK